VNGQLEVPLKDLVTYVGTTNQAQIKIKGFLAPSIAAAISRRPDGYFLKAVKAGYPKVNGNAIQEQVLLENGAMIEVGGTSMVFHASIKNQARRQVRRRNRMFAPFRCKRQTSSCDFGHLLGKSPYFALTLWEYHAIQILLRLSKVGVN